MKNTLAYIVGIALLLVLAGAFLVNQKSFKTEKTVPNTASTVTPVVSPEAEDSKTVLDENEISKVDVDSIDKGLNEVEKAPRIRLKKGTSSNWAGYAVETNLTNPQNNAVSDVKGSWTVPTANCNGVTTNTYSASWIGIDGYSDNSVEQIGTEQDCINGKVVYSAWYEMYPKPSYRVNLPVNPGDLMSAEVAYTGKNTFTLTLTNTKTSQTFKTIQKSNAQRQSAEWIIEAPWSGGVLPLTNFGTETFNNASVTLNGQTGTISNSNWQNDGITMETSSGTIKALTSPLNPDGSSFSVTWKSN